VRWALGETYCNGGGGSGAAVGVVVIVGFVRGKQR
jgi:hypothetical protein